jgi:hypothetical protein
MEKGELSKIREKKGESGAYKYQGTKAGSAYAGPDKTFPMGDVKHARNALARAHYAKNPEGVKEKVYAKYPALEKRHEKREELDEKKYNAYRSR